MRRVPTVVAVDTRTQMLSRYLGPHRTHRAQLLGQLNGDNRVDIEHFRLYPDASVQYSQEHNPEAA